MQNYFEIILEDKIYSQRTPNSKFIEFTLDGIKQNSYDELPFDIKEIIDTANDMQLNPKKYFDYIALKDDTIAIIEVIPTKSQYIRIPEAIDGKPVTMLGPELCRNIKDTVTQFQLPETITAFSDNTFGYCEKLKYVNIPEQVKHIPEYCFIKCINLRKIDLENIETIGEQAFKECHSLKEIKLNKIKNMDTAVFYYCANLQSIEINSDDLEEISDGTFMRCDKLTKLKLSDNIKIIGKSSFRGCTSLSLFVGPKNLEKIKDMAFSGNQLQNITLYDKLEEIGKLSFYTLYDYPTKVTITDETIYYSDSFSKCSEIKIIGDDNFKEKER